MNKEDERRTEKFLEELKKKCGGVDFRKNPPTKREMYEAIKRTGGCLSLQEIAYNRRRIKKHRLKYE